MKNKIFFVLIIFSLGILTSGCNSEDKKIKHAKENELAKLFLQYYPEAQPYFNSENTKITFIATKDDKELYIQVPAEEKIEADETLYCMKIDNSRNEILFSEDNKDLIEIKLKNNRCFE